MTRFFILFLLACCALPIGLLAQNAPVDSVPNSTLERVTISAYRLEEQAVKRLEEVSQTYIFSGKKTEIIDVAGLNANLAEKAGRQVFAKVPGVFVYDMDGSGNQINISTRGLDPHRSWEFNVRYDGVLVNSDMYGYPASHFSAPLESVARIEVVRGTGALQYGAQFGGMVNYVPKSPDTTRSIGGAQQLTVGSYGLFSSYTSVGGRKGDFTYQAYYNRRFSDGYRDNARSDGEAWFGQLHWQPSARFSLKAELAHSQYQHQLPGPLTDALFAANPRQSTRSRNYYSPDIYVPSLRLDWHLGRSTYLQATASAVYGSRNSVLYDRFANILDTINRATGDYNTRQVDIDNFASHTLELRLLQHYTALGNTHTLLLGGQLMYNNMHRRQQGKGTTGFDYDLTLTTPGWGRDLWYRTRNVAFFAENMFHLGRRFVLSPGVRIEVGNTDATGSITYYNPEQLPNSIDHKMPLFGLSAKYQVAATHEAYAGWSQAYRPVIFKDIIPATAFERADKNLRDADGYTAEIGLRGKSSWLRYDIGAFYLLYRNRLGNLLLEDPSTNEAYVFKTNIGDSRTYGSEAFVEITPWRRKEWLLAGFVSAAWFNARYLDAEIAVGTANVSVKDKRLEGVPEWIVRSGLNAAWRRWSGSLLYSYVGDNFADPLNTVEPSANGAKGLVPAYGVLDLNMAYRLTSQFTLRLGVNNLTDLQYYTKRPTFYPGPGIWTSDGRSVQLSAALQF